MFTSETGQQALSLLQQLPGKVIFLALKTITMMVTMVMVMIMMVTVVRLDPLQKLPTKVSNPLGVICLLAHNYHSVL